MQNVAIVEEVVELMPVIGRGLYATLLNDTEIQGLTLPQIKALIFLYNNGECSMSELAAGLAVSLPSASELVDRLVDRDLVIRTRDTVDRRRVLIALSEPAIGYGRRIHDLRRSQAQAALDAMPPEERDCFLRSMRALATALEPGVIAATGVALAFF
ncbi:MAG: winged helix-turn-helix transcriptional regulator [Thermomicrobiales bacterium]|nr:winged helix-turn-helix transcriptional regulator [Thermomicrobiales bacterium]MCO5223491.1 MarR family winged helix-turn-helix transcriptional regulator [Thermomicrobiales bacterium]